MASRLSSALISISFTAEHINTTWRIGWSHATRSYTKSCKNDAFAKYRLSSIRNVTTDGCVSTSWRLMLRKCWVVGTRPTSATCGFDVLYRNNPTDRITPAETPTSTPIPKVRKIVANTAVKSTLE